MRTRALTTAAAVVLVLVLGVAVFYAGTARTPPVAVSSSATPIPLTTPAATAPISCAAAGAAAAATDAESLGELSFVDTQHGWVVALGSAGWSLLRTSDGGARWSRFPLTDLIDVREMRFADACRGWLVVTTPSKTVSLRATVDGGATWREQLSRHNGSSTGVPTAITGLQVIDATHSAVIADADGCSVVDCPAELLVTADAGARWTKVYGAAHVTLARFVDAGHGWIVSSGAAFGPGSLFATGDGGTTWSARTMPPFAGALTFIDATTGWALGRDGGYCTSSFCDRWYLYGTRDGGTTWSTLQDAPGSRAAAWWLPNPKASVAGFLTGPVFVDPSTGWIGLSIGAGGAGERIGGIITTTDGGRSWQESGIEPYPTDVSSFAFVDARTGWADGRSPIKRGPAELFRTTDGGRTWQRQLPDNFTASAAPPSATAAPGLCTNPQMTTRAVIERYFELSASKDPSAVTDCFAAPWRTRFKANPTWDAVAAEWASAGPASGLQIKFGDAVLGCDRYGVTARLTSPPPASTGSWFITVGPEGGTPRIFEMGSALVSEQYATTTCK